MYLICKQHHFSASHRLKGVPEDHPCGRLHGHNYKVEVMLAGTKVNEVGWVRDFAALDPVWEYIDTYLDHRHLNEVLPGRTTAECIAEHLYVTAKEKVGEVGKGGKVVAVRVWETPKSWAVYTGAKITVEDVFRMIQRGVDE